jgi:hypothetical protein
MEPSPPLCRCRVFEGLLRERGRAIMNIIGVGLVGRGGEREGEKDRERERERES